MRVSGSVVDTLSAVVATWVGVSSSLLLKPSPGAFGASTLLALVSGLAMAVVRRHPGPVLAVQVLVVVACGVLVKPALVPVLMLLVSLGVLTYRSDWRIAALGWVFAVIAVFSLGGAIAGPIITVGVAGLLAAPVAFGRYLRGVRLAAAVAAERVAEAEVWREVETRAVLQGERSRLARDLHDIVAHHVGAMTLRASSARLALVTSGDTEVAAAALADVTTTGRRVLDELRGLLSLLRDPDAIDGQPLAIEPKAAIADAVDRVRRAGVPVTLSLDRRIGEMSLVTRTTVARLVQEALTNVLKHAGPGTATRVTATVGPPDLLRLSIENDPPAGPPPVATALPASGHGLAGMRDRVGLLGGVLVAGPTPERGWSVTATLPTLPALPAPPAAPAEPDLPAVPV